jgi:hypothetical protein
VLEERRERERKEREERCRKVEEKFRKQEEKLVREGREREERLKEREEREGRLRNIEKMMEKGAVKKTERNRMSEDTEGEVREKENKCLQDRIEVIEVKIKEGVKSSMMEARKAHKRIDKLESEMSKDRTERQDHEWNVKEDKEIQDKDSEMEMKRNLEGAMEPIKILNMDFVRVCEDRKCLGERNNQQNKGKD